MADDQVQVKFGAQTGDFNAAMQQVVANVSQAMDKVSQALNQTSETSKKAGDAMQQQIRKISETAGACGNAASGSFTSGAQSVVSGWEKELQRMKDLQENWETWSNERELAFWQAKLAATRAGSDAWFAAWHHIAELSRAITAAQRSEQEKQARDADAMQNIALKGEQRHQEAVYNLQMEDLQTRQRLGQISAQEELALQRQLLDTKFAAEKADLAARLSLKNLEPKEVARINVELQALEDNRRLAMKKNDDQMAIETQNRWKSIISPITSSFSQAISGMITKTTSFRDAVRSVFQSLLSHVIDMIAKKLEAWILGETAQPAASAAGSVARRGIEETASK